MAGSTAVTAAKAKAETAARSLPASP